MLRSPLLRVLSALFAIFAWAYAPRVFAQPKADAGAAPVAANAATDAGAPTTPTAVPEQPAEPQVKVPQSEAERAAGQTITRIEVAGNRRVSSEDVLSYLHIRPGQQFKPTALTSDVRALWDSGFFDDIEVDLVRVDAGVVLRFIVRERPNVQSVEFSGNDEIENDKLQEVIEVKGNTSLSVPAIRRSVQKIKDAYAEKGFYLAEVDFTLQNERDNEVIVKFKIVEHQPVTVRRINFVGNNDVPEADLREVMATGQSSFFSFGSGGAYKQDILERDVLMVSALYYDKGYLSVQVGTPRVMLTPDRTGIEVTLVIHEGPRFKIRRLQILEKDQDGKEIEPLGGRRALRQMLRAHAGDYFNRAELLKDLTAIRTLYRDAGYANVEAEPEPEIDPLKQEVDIIIPIRRGPLVHVERIGIKGNTKTKDKVIRREMEIEEGQLFSETRLEDSKRRIQALGYFERVDISTEQGSTPERIIIHFEVQEKPTGTFQVGAGFSSVENFIATAQIQQANLFGHGQSIALQAQVSSLRQLINLRLFEPYLFDSDWSGSAEVFNQLYQFTDFSRRTIGGSLTLGYALIQPWLRLSLTATAQYDAAETGTTASIFGSSPTAFAQFSRLPLANLFNNGRTFSLRPAITYDTRDNRLFPTSGILASFSTEFADEILGSQIEFIRNTFNFRFYIPLGGQTGQPGSGFVLKANTNIGLITSPNPEGLPIYIRYFLGGILDMRGYRLRTLGPRLPLNTAIDVNSQPAPNGSPIGGNLQAYTNFEFEFPVIDKVGIRGVTFFDIGNTWNLEAQFCRTAPAPQFASVVSPCWNGLGSMANLRTAAGFGVRWFSPLGPLRFEWGFPFKPLGYEESSVFEFTIGNFF